MKLTAAYHGGTRYDITSDAHRVVTDQSIKDFALAHGPAYAHPRMVIFASSIPVASTHKVDRRALIEEATGAVRKTGRR